MSFDRPERVMLDPSVVLLPQALPWLQDADLRDSILISRALAIRIQEDRLGDFAPFVDEPVSEDLRAAIVGVRTFSWRNTRVEHPEIVEALLALEGGDVFADQYAYLVSHSWLAVLERTRDWVGDARKATAETYHEALETLDAFAKAGIKRFTVADTEVAVFLKHARGKLPNKFVDRLKDVKRVGDAFADAAKRPMLVAGGAGAGAIVALAFPGLTVPSVAVGLLLAGTAIIAGDP